MSRIFKQRVSNLSINVALLQHTGERSITLTCAVSFKRFSGSTSGGSAGVCDETSEGQDKNPRETDNA